MPFPRPTLTQLRTQAMQDIVVSDLPNADGFLRRSALRVLAWVQAGLAYLHYGFLDWISRQSTPFTATDEYLDAWAALAPTPVLREAPTFASGPAVFSGVAGTVLPNGTVCTRGDLAQFITAANGTVGGGGTVTVTVTALVAGSAGNTASGAPLTLATVVPGITSLGSASAAITGGTDLELNAALKTRMLESYAAPPHGGDASDYVTWALQVPGVTRAWTPATPLVPGSVTVFFMMDESEAAFGGFPQGTNGVAALETRDTPATGDQLAVANHIYPLRPVTPIVYANAPTATTQAFTIQGLSAITAAQKTQVSDALTGLFLQKDSPLATTSIQQSDVDAAISAVSGLPSFAVTSPSVWPITSSVGAIFTLGTVTYT
ncbi:MAG TPA: baseplate J/gp47 family protein [Chloroflexota bacterium]